MAVGTNFAAPHGIPMNVPYSPTDELNRFGARDYGTAEPVPDPTQDAYDRYVQEPYDKQPIKFDQLPQSKTCFL